MGPVRINFLLESLRDLDASLQRRGSRLIVLRGDPRSVLPEILSAWGVRRLCYERDTEPYALARDAAVAAAAAATGVDVLAPSSHTLYDVDALLALNHGKAPASMTAFQKLVAKAPPVAAAADAPGTLPPVDDGRLATTPGDAYRAGGCVPSLEELGHQLPKAGPPPFRVRPFCATRQIWPRHILGTVS